MPGCAVFAAAVFLALLIGPCFATVAGDLPFGPHDWAQSDRYAVAQRFLDDDSWNIFDPRVLTRFPVDGRVNVELPLTQFLAARIAHLAGRQSLPFVLRLTTLVLSMLGPLALFVLVWTRTRSFIAGLLPMVCVAASPILVYYATNTLPDGPGLGLTLIGFALLLSGENPPSSRRTVLGIAVMTLAGLVKMSFAPYLLVPAALLVIQRHNRREGPTLGGLPRGPAIALPFSAALLLVQVVVLKYRARAFSPTFCTADTHPFTSLHQMAEVVRVMSSGWLGDLFSMPQLVVLAAGLALVVFSMFSRRRPDDLAVASAVAAGVMVALFILFGSQLAIHDYYAIAMFYPLVALLVVRLALAVSAWCDRADVLWRRWSAMTLLLVATFAAALPVGENFQRRTTPWWRMQNEWLREARRDLDACGDRCAGPVAVIGSQPPNLALVYLGRQGYSTGIMVDDTLAPARFASFEDAARYLDRHGVCVLVVRRRAMRTLPQAELDRDFAAVDETGEGYVFVRRKS